MLELWNNYGVYILLGLPVAAIVFSYPEASSGCD